MVKTNGFASHKVLRAVGLISVGILLSIDLLATDEPVSKVDQWVDSVYNNLSQDQKILQLLFPIVDDPSMISEQVGGLITTGNSNLIITPGSQLSVLKGFLSKDYLFQTELNLKPEILASSVDPELSHRAGYLSGLRSREKGYDFTVFSGVQYPKISSNSEREDLLLRGYQTGLYESGISTWHLTNSARNGMKDARNLHSYLLEHDLDVTRLRKKDLKKLRKTANNKELLFYQTNAEDLNLSNAILGSDVIIFEGGYQFYLSFIKTMIAKNKLKKKQLEKKVKKVLTIKYEVTKETILQPDLIGEKLLQRDVWEQSAVVARNNEGILPIRKLDDRSFASLSLGVFAPGSFQKSLDNYTYFSHFEEADFLHNEKRLLNILTHYDYVIAGFSFPDLVDPDNADVKRRIEFLETLSLQTKVVVVVFAEPKWLTKFNSPHSVILSHLSDNGVQEVAPQIIFGALQSSGSLPIDLSDEFGEGTGYRTESLTRLKYSFPEDEGFDSEMEKKIDFIASKAIENFATPGCQVLVARNGDVVLNKSYGHYTYDSIQNVSTQTLYDLASVTKVTGTLQATMFLAGQKAFDIEDKASSILKELEESNKEDLVIRNILTHQAGLQSYYPFYKKTFRGDRLNPDYFQLTAKRDYNQAIGPGLFGHEALEDSVWNWTINSTLRKKPDWQEEYDYTYSDLGFLMMFKLNERLINQPMEEFLSQNFYDPLGMSSTCYQPLCRFPLNNIAPTEVDYDFRNALVWGLVHDENAALTGGVGGHAGLFSNANDLAKLLEMNLRDGHYGGVQYIRKGTISKFTEKQFPGNRRGLGWDKPSFGDYRNTSRHSSRSTFGHLGFTGTAVWVDPKYELIYIFLSNRIHPNRENDKLMVDNIRSRIHEVIYESMPEFRQGSSQ